MLIAQVSMSSLERDGMSKMQHVIHTIKNMLRYFVNDLKGTDIYISLITFDDRVDCIIEKILLSNDNLNELITIVDGIYSRSMTNISAAISAAKRAEGKLRREDRPHTHSTHRWYTDMRNDQSRPAQGMSRRVVS